MLVGKDYFSSFARDIAEVVICRIFPKLDPIMGKELAIVAKIFLDLRERYLLKLIEENKDLQFTAVILGSEKRAAKLFDEEISSLIESKMVPSEKIRRVRAYLDSMQIGDLYLLHYLASRVSIEGERIFDLVLRLGANPNQIICGGTPTALFHLMQCNNGVTSKQKYTVAIKLIDAGADVRVVNIAKNTVFGWQRGYLNCLNGRHPPGSLSETEINLLEEYAKKRMAFTGQDTRAIPTIDPIEERKAMKELYGISDGQLW